MKFKIEFGIPRINHFFKIGLFPVLDVDADNVHGINSNVNKGRHVVQLDYDDILSFDHLVKELKGLIKKFGLGDLEIYETSNRKYYVFGFFERLTYKDLIWVTYSANCCQNFKKWRMMRDCSTLRLSVKNVRGSYVPRFVGVVKGMKKELHLENRKYREYVYTRLGVKKNGDDCILSSTL